MPFYVHIQAALDGLIHLETGPSCPPELPNPLPVGQPTLVVTSGVYGVRCFLGSVHADHQLTRPDGCFGNKKSHLQLHSGRTLQVSLEARTHV